MDCDGCLDRLDEVQHFAGCCCLVDLQAAEVADYIGLAALAGDIGRAGACRL